MAKKVEENIEMKDIATTNRNVVESYISATGHQNLNIFSERLLLQLVKAAQCQVYGVNFRDGSGIRQLNIGKLGDAEVEIDARELLGTEGSRNYTHAKQAVLELMNKTVTNERPAYKNGKILTDENGDTVYQFEAHNVLNDVYINRKPGTIIVNVNKATWETILDFSKGFRRYDLDAASRLSRTYSVRIFKLISNQTMPLTYTIDELRDQWGLKDKYASTSSFIKNTIDSAKAELDENSPWTFDYEPVYNLKAKANNGRKGRKAVTGIIFYPKHQVRYETTTNTLEMLKPQDVLSRSTIDRLVRNIGFSMNEIKQNLSLLGAAKKHFDLDDFLLKITPKAGRAGNPQGYTINALKIKLKEDYGVVIKKNIIQAPKDATKI